MLPGISLHDELALLREAGLGPFEVLQAATRDAELELGASADIGTVEPGKGADLLILSDDPRGDPAALRTPVAILVRGRWLGEPPAPQGPPGPGSGD